MNVIRQPSFAAVREIVEQRQMVKFRYGSSKNLVVVDTFTASAIVEMHRVADSVGKAKIERMAKSSASDFSRLAQFCVAKVGNRKVPSPEIGFPVPPGIATAAATVSTAS